MNEIKSIVGKFAWGFLIVSIIWFVYALFNVGADDCSGIMAWLTEINVKFLVLILD